MVDPALQKQGFALLSYRHSFHAGNFADVLKHIVVVEVLAHLALKSKSFAYIDTHAGAGLFDLKSADAGRLHEYRDGIGRLLEENWPELERYLGVVRAHNEGGMLETYPGSPLIAMHFLREQDRAWLHELHPRDFELLRANVAGRRHVRVLQEDGLQGLLGLLPPISRRALVLIDPSYEIKSDYQGVIETLCRAQGKFSTGTYAIWYPVVERRRIDAMEGGLIASSIRNIQRFELGVRPDSEARGMTAAGMIVVNPPWTLMDHMSRLLPRLTAALADANAGSYRCEVLVEE